LTGQIRVWECEKRERANGKGEYYFITGKMAGLASSFVSVVPLAPGEHEVNVTLSEYGGQFRIRIEGLAKTK